MERLIADSLAKHAADAPADDHLLAGVHARLHRRRTHRAIGAVVVAAAAVATAITASQGTTSPQPAQQVPERAWRWESFKTVQVQVPSTWTQYVSGTAPCPATLGNPVIGRLNDWLDSRGPRCMATVLPLNERQDYVWFNDVRAPGTERYDGGWTEETRVVAGVKVSVLTRDDKLRERILDTARPIDGTDYYGCAPRDPGDQSGKLGTDEVTAVDVCEYYNGSLVAGSALTPAQAAQYASQLGVARNQPLIPAIRCPQTPHVFVITVHTRTSARPLRVFVSPCRKPDPDSLIQQGPHLQSQPAALPTNPSPR